MESEKNIQEEVGAVDPPSTGSDSASGSSPKKSGQGLLDFQNMSLSPEQVEEFRSAFEMFDIDKDGCITGDELKTIMQNLRIEVTDIEISSMIQRVDIDGNGTIEFNEFLEMMARRLRRQALVSDEERRKAFEREARQAFKVFDINGDGVIDKNEITSTMINLGEQLSPSDIDAMIKIADKNGDGKVDYNEFIEVLTRH